MTTEPPPMQVSVAFQMEPLWQHGRAGEHAFGGDLAEFAKGMTAYLAEQIEKFADPRGADLFLALTVKRGEETASRQYRSGHYVKEPKPAVDPLSVRCPRCTTAPTWPCRTASDKKCKPHTARVRLARVVAADSDPVLDAHFPKVGPCGICGTPGLDQRHRVVDAIAGRLEGGEDPQQVADDYDLPLEAMRVVEAWAKRWAP